MSCQIIFTRSNPISPDPRVEKAACCLQNAGYSCKALGWARQYSERNEQSSFNLSINRMYFPGKFGGGFLNFLGLIVFNLWLLYNHLINRPKVVHAYDLDTVVPALVARFFVKTKVVYDIADWYADSRKVSFLRSFVAKFERWVCYKADLVILPHENRLQQVGFEPIRWIVIYNSPEDILSNQDFNIQPNKDYFAYVGVLQPDRGILQIIKAAAAAKVKFVIAGFGPLVELLKSQGEKEEFVKFRGKVSYNEALAIEKNALAILALYDPEIPNNQFAAPNKLYEAMMLGKPIITTSGTSAGKVVEAEGIGIIVTYGDIKALTKALIFLKNNSSQREQMGQRARMLYDKQYSFVKQSQKLQLAYKALIK
ncbi:MAG: glycosyltransferase [Eubacteriales bacterium]